MAGALQTVPARHGVATFVPARHTLKVVNTYGTQTVDVWAFALGRPPEGMLEKRKRGDEEEEEEEVMVTRVEGEEEDDASAGGGEEMEAVVVEGEEADFDKEETRGRAEAQAGERGMRDSPGEDDADETTPTASPAKEAAAATPPPPPEKVDENNKQIQQTNHPKPAARSWSAYASYVPSLRSRSKKAAVSTADKEEKERTEVQTPQRTARSSYTAYLPSLPLRARAKGAAAPEKTDDGGGSATGQEREKEKSDVKEDAGSFQSTSDYVSAEEGEVKEKADSGQETDTELNNNMNSSVASTKSWGSYLPSIPMRKPAGNKNMETHETAQSASSPNKNAKGWLSYIPSGKSFTSYLPPKGKEALSAFAASHYRDPSKSYGEQLYEFSKTPVGAFGLSAAAGSGTAGSLYAAYSAYVKLQATRRSTEPMEYLSLPHTVAASTHLAPRVGDALVTNLRNPLLTLLEDTTPAASSGDDGVPLRHGTLLPACDPAVYAQLALMAGRARGEEHGSCAENLVLALQSFNKSTRLQGARAVGADVTINSAPTPLSLFLNSRVDGATGEVRIGAPRTYEGGRLGRPGQKGGYVVLRAERDVVVVLSACPMDVGDMNGGRCMAANFVVEEPPVDEEQAGDDGAKEEADRVERARAYGRALGAVVQESGVGVPGDAVESTEALDASAGGQSPAAGEVRNRPRPGRKKPRKLERRSGSAAVK